MSTPKDAPPAHVRRKTPEEALEDIRSAFGFACRVALDYEVERETLVGLLEFALDHAEQVLAQRQERAKKSQS